MLKLKALGHPPTTPPPPHTPLGSIERLSYPDNLRFTLRWPVIIVMSFSDSAIWQ